MIHRLNLMSNTDNKNFISKRDNKLPVNVDMIMGKNDHEGPLNLQK